MSDDGYCEVDFEGDSDDAEPCEFFTSDTVKASRKAHACDECGGVIAKGESYHRKAYRFEGKFQTERVCVACREVAGEFDHRLCGSLLWSSFAEQWESGTRLQGCLNRLTSVRAKETMRAQWQKWHEQHEQRERSRQERLRQIRESHIAANQPDSGTR